MGRLKAPRAMDPVGLGTKNPCSGEAQQQFSSQSAICDLMLSTAVIMKNTGTRLSIFWKNVLPPSSWSTSSPAVPAPYSFASRAYLYTTKMEALISSKTSVNFWRIRQCNNIGYSTHVIYNNFFGEGETELKGELSFKAIVRDRGTRMQFCLSRPQNAQKDIPAHCVWQGT
jgi:hypothetical protein